jgi:hypothetical protein
MFLKHKRDGSLIEVLDPQILYDPYQTEFPGRFHAGEELQEPEKFSKLDVIFPSGESLPRCWVDGNYQQQAA